MEHHLPSELHGRVSITKAYVGKIGFVRLELNGDYREKVAATEDNNAFNEFIEELFSLLSKSPHVMEISPRREELLLGSQADDPEMFFHIWPYASALSSGKFLRMRVAMPKRKQEALYRPFSRTWNPEQFTLYFDGAIFFVCAPVESTPVLTDIGQIAREFLVETLRTSKLWTYVEGIGPTPMHPEVYLLAVTPDKTERDRLTTELPLTDIVDEDLIAVIPSTFSIDQFLDYFLYDTHVAAESFYGAMVALSKLDRAINALNGLNQQLSESLDTYFHQAPIARLFSRVSGDIRKLLGTMHVALQAISTLELQVQDEQEGAIRYLQRTEFLTGLEGYAREQMVSRRVFDKSSQLTLMNFAAEETINVAIIQATVVAALIGGIIGGLATLLIQFVSR